MSPKWHRKYRKAIKARARYDTPVPQFAGTPAGVHMSRRPTSPDRAAWLAAQASNDFWSKNRPKTARAAVNAPAPSPPDSRDACTVLT